MEESRASSTECQLRYRIHSGRQAAAHGYSSSSSSVNSGTQRQQKDAAVECALRIFRLCVRTPSSFAKGSATPTRSAVYDGFTAADRQRKETSSPCATNLADWTLHGCHSGVPGCAADCQESGTPALLQLAVTAVADRRLRANQKEARPEPPSDLHRVDQCPCQSDTEFDCGAGRCIDSRLRCNGYANCPDVEDEGRRTVLAGAAGLAM
uniref:Disintegrin domain-containing protein n=1 Tax=Macrostomum lignano TaxID=282301 RepID=A0A1I8FGQ7_9PLAT